MYLTRNTSTKRTDSPRFIYKLANLDLQDHKREIMEYFIGKKLIFENSFNEMASLLQCNGPQVKSRYFSREPGRIFAAPAGQL